MGLVIPDNRYVFMQITTRIGRGDHQHHYYDFGNRLESRDNMTEVIRSHKNLKKASYNRISNRNNYA